jgi:hypothetical protein
VSTRKIGFLILLLCFGAVLETAWRVREGGVVLGPEGCRVLGGRFYGPSFTFEDSQTRTLPPGEAPRVEIRNEFGDVTVSGGDGEDVQVRLRKVVYLPTEEKARALADRIEIRTEMDGGSLRVGTNRDELVGRRDAGFETHLELRVPAATEVEIRNDHGEAAARGVARADVRASFGEVRVNDVSGPVEIESRHGAVRATGLGAELTIDARHGDVELERVGGTVDLSSEHGAVRIQKTRGLEARVAFGELSAQTVDGDLAVVSSHGAVLAKDVTGRASAETSFAEIRLTGIGGDAVAKSQHGGIVAIDVRGSVHAETSHAGVELGRVKGLAEVTVEHGGLDARELFGGATVRGSGGDVTIDGFAGPVDVVVERAAARLSAREPDVPPISASASEVRLVVPAGSRFSLDAESRHGELRLDLPGRGAVSPDEEGRTRATATVGGGGSAVTLRAEGDVVVESAPRRTPAEAE